MEQTGIKDKDVVKSVETTLLLPLKKKIAEWEADSNSSSAI